MTCWERPTVYGIVSDQIGEDMLLIHSRTTRLGTQVFSADLEELPSDPSPQAIRAWMRTSLEHSQSCITALIGQQEPNAVLEDIGHVVLDWAAWLNA